jgi:1-pyrroline-5-carboxylate dehydrogenase
MDGVTRVPAPRNEPVLNYAPGSPERAALESRLGELAGAPVELPMTAGGRRRMPAGAAFDVVQPHRHAAVLGTSAHATHADAEEAVRAAKEAAPGWAELSFDDRAAVFLRAADLLAGPWRQTLNAATMLGQSKTCYQAEIDAACELIDFWRYNVHFAREILAEQPVSSPGVWNRVDHRPLEGFVYAITPFNFTAIAGNLPTAPALMGNTVVWKPAPTQLFAAHLTLQLLEAAGLPPGVVNLVPGDGVAVSEVVLADRDLAGIHFTGSTAVFQHLWRTVGENIAGYRTYPRIVGETGGKDFVLAHPSADVDVLRTALIRGAFEYQGQKCSAASRAYVPRSVWARLRDDLVDQTEALPMGDVTDLSNFMGAVIDRRSFDKLARVLDSAKNDSALSIVAGGTADDSEGFFVRPTIVEGTDPAHEVFTTEYFGPVLAVHVYDDAEYDRVLTQMEAAAPYALTGAVIAQDRTAIAHAQRALRHAAGNFYVNDKPTGAVVGQQPFGGGRASGTNDKAGAAQNLQRWTSTRSIKETFVPATDHRYPHMG